MVREPPASKSILVKKSTTVFRPESMYIIMNNPVKYLILQSVVSRLQKSGASDQTAVLRRQIKCQEPYSKQGETPQPFHYGNISFFV